jgi:hypothetical protein
MERHGAFMSKVGMIEKCVSGGRSWVWQTPSRRTPVGRRSGAPQGKPRQGSSHQSGAFIVALHWSEAQAPRQGNDVSLSLSRTVNEGLDPGSFAVGGHPDWDRPSCRFRRDAGEDAGVGERDESGVPTRPSAVPNPARRQRSSHPQPQSARPGPRTGGERQPMVGGRHALTSSLGGPSQNQSLSPFGVAFCSPHCHSQPSSHLMTTSHPNLLFQRLALLRSWGDRISRTCGARNFGTIGSLLGNRAEAADDHSFFCSAGFSVHDARISHRAA